MTKLPHPLPEALDIERSSHWSARKKVPNPCDLILLRLPIGRQRGKQYGRDEYEFGAFSSKNHLITLSALASTFGGIVSPICFAVFKLITSSNFVGRSTGRSAGLAPFRILST